MSELVTLWEDEPCDVCGGTVKRGEQVAKTVAGHGDWDCPESDLRCGPFQTFIRHPDCDEGWGAISRELSDGEEFCAYYDCGTSDYVFDRLDDLIDIRQKGLAEFSEASREAIAKCLNRLAETQLWKEREAELEESRKAMASWGGRQ
jgi:hypothetical protein